MLSHFLSVVVPAAPQVDPSCCVVRDNTVTVAWQPAGEGVADGSGRIERYDVEYRKTNQESPLRAAGACWEKIHDITDTRVTITGERSKVILAGQRSKVTVTEWCFCVSGLKFDSHFVVVRVRARNKAAAGEFSEHVAIETTGKHTELIHEV